MAAAKKIARSADTTVVETVKKTKVKRTPFKLPKTLAQCADLAYQRRADRLEVQREATAIGEEEKQLKEHLIQNLPKSQASGVSGKVANAKIDKKKVPTIEDKKKLLAHVKKTGDWDLLTIGINTAAVEERWEQKKKVPGVGSFEVIKVSLTKVG